MVTTTDTTQIVTEPKVQPLAVPSLKRWFKHFIYLPATHRFFSKTDQRLIAEAVQQAECGHVGEIQVVIEGHIPASQAYRQDTRRRAQQLFAELGVWDTEKNSGILLYLNLCERKVEIVIDRGLNAATEQQTWDDICQAMIEQLKAQQYLSGVIQGVIQIGQVLATFYGEDGKDDMNELSNAPVILN